MADLDGDGWRELVSGGANEKLKVFAGVGTGLVGEGRTLLALDRTADGGAADTSVVVVDWDGDGLLDLLVGTLAGKVYFVRNGGSALRPEYGRYPAVALQSAGEDLRVVLSAAPCAGDWDGDGDLDLVVGDRGGNVWLFRNEGGGGRARLGAAELLVEHAEDPGEGPQEYAHPTLVDWNADGRVDLLVGDEWIEKLAKPVLSEEQAAELEAAHEEVRMLEGRIGGARQRIGDELCRELGLDWRELWKLEGEPRKKYYATLEARLEQDQARVNARAAIEAVAQRARRFQQPMFEHGRVWVFLRAAPGERR